MNATSDAPQRAAYTTLRAFGVDPPTEHLRKIALQAVSQGDCGNVRRDIAVDLMTEMLQQRVTDFSCQAIAVSSDRVDYPVPCEFPARAVEGALWLDAALAESLRSIGSYGARLAEKLWENARIRWHTYERAPGDLEANNELWRLWIPRDQGIVPFALLMARSLENDVLRPGVKASKPPALSKSVIDRFPDAFWNAERSVVRREDGLVIMADNGKRIGAFLRTNDHAPELPADISDGLSLSSTRSLTAHRLIRWLVCTGYGQRYLTKMRDFRTLRIEHGFTGLASKLDVNGGKGTYELRRALEVLQFAQLRLPRGDIGGLLTWVLGHPAHGRPSLLSITLGEALLPDYVPLLPKGGVNAQRARMLVPIPNRLPPMVGRARDHAAQAALQLLVMSELRFNATDLVERGAVEIPRRTWKELADRAELPNQLLDGVIECWLQGGPNGAAFLSSPSRGSFTLSVPTYGPELSTLVDAGKAEIKGRKWAERRRKWGSSRTHFPRKPEHIQAARFHRKPGTLSP